MTQTSDQGRPGRYTKKPITIEAVQWFKHGDHPDVRPVSDSDHLYFTGMGGATLTDTHLYGVIGTLESPNHLVTPGDWIITGVQGELYACKPDVFALTYEPERLPYQTRQGSTKPAKVVPDAYLVYAKGSTRYWVLTLNPDDVPEIYKGGETVPLYRNAATPQPPESEKCQSLPHW